MRLVKIEEVDRDAWSKFVYDQSNGNVFQTKEMYEVYKNTKNYSPLFVAVTNDDREILGERIR